MADFQMTQKLDLQVWSVARWLQQRDAEGFLCVLISRWPGIGSAGVGMYSSVYFCISVQAPTESWERPLEQAVPTSGGGLCVGVLPASGDF